MIDFIDPNNLYRLAHVWRISRSKVEDNIKGIEHGNDFPPIDVVEFEDLPGKFLVLEGYHRSVGHYKKSRPIKANIDTERKATYGEPYNGERHVKEIVLI